VAKTIPSAVTVIDPIADITARRIAVVRQMQHPLEAAHFLYSRQIRRPIWGADLQQHKYGANAALQGVGSLVNDTQGSLVDRFNFFYRARAIPDNHNLVRVNLRAEASVGNGKIEIGFKVRAGTGGDIETLNVTVNNGAAAEYEATASLGALDGNTTYLGIVRMQAAVGGSCRLHRIYVYEIEVPLASMPTGP